VNEQPTIASDEDFLQSVGGYNNKQPSRQTFLSDDEFLHSLDSGAFPAPESPGERNFLDKITESFRRGKQEFKMDQRMGLAVITGDQDQYDTLKAERDTYQKAYEADPIQADNIIERAFTDAARMMYGMAQSFGTKVAGAATGAGVALLAGQAGPQAAAPEEIVTVPAAAYWGWRTGGLVGGMAPWYLQGVGQQYSEMREKGFDHDAAKAAAVVSAGPYAAVEFINEFIPVKRLFPGLAAKMQPLLAKTAGEIAGRVAKQYAKNVVGEVAEEGIQQGIQEATDAITAELQGRKDLKPDIKEALRNVWDATVSAVPATMALGLPGAKYTAAAEYKGMKLQKGLETLGFSDESIRDISVNLGMGDPVVEQVKQTPEAFNMLSEYEAPRNVFRMAAESRMPEEIAQAFRDGFDRGGIVAGAAAASERFNVLRNIIPNEVKHAKGTGTEAEKAGAEAGVEGGQGERLRVRNAAENGLATETEPQEQVATLGQPEPQPEARFVSARSIPSGVSSRSEILPLTEASWAKYVRPVMGTTAYTFDTYKAEFPAHTHIALEQLPGQTPQLAGLGSKTFVESPYRAQKTTYHLVSGFDTPQAIRQSVRPTEAFIGTPERIRFEGNQEAVLGKVTAKTPNEAPAAWADTEGQYLARPKVERVEGVYLGRMNEITPAGQIERLFGWNGDKWQRIGLAPKRFSRNQLRQQALAFAEQNPSARIPVVKATEPAEKIEREIPAAPDRMPLGMGRPEKDMPTLLTDKDKRENWFTRTARFIGAMPLFMGNKREMAAPVAKAVQNEFTPDERNNITQIDEYFGGGGGWGIHQALSQFLSVKQINIHELDPERIQMIRFIHERGNKLWDYLNASGAIGIIKGEWNRTNTGEIKSGGGLTRRLNDVLERNEWDKKPLTQDQRVGLHIVSELLPTAGAIRDANLLKKSLEDSIGAIQSQQTAPAHEAAQRFIKEHGGQINYIQGDSYAAQPTQGKHVLSIVDPPYVFTTGYGKSDKMAGSDIYAKTADLNDRLIKSGNNVIYTDSAWWLPAPVRGKNMTAAARTEVEREREAKQQIPTAEKNRAIEILGRAYGTFEKFKPVEKVIGGYRHEVLGIHNAMRPERPAAAPAPAEAQPKAPTAEEVEAKRKEIENNLPYKVGTKVLFRLTPKSAVDKRGVVSSIVVHLDGSVVTYVKQDKSNAAPIELDSRVGATVIPAPSEEAREKALYTKARNKDELAAYTPEQQKQIKKDAAEFDRLVQLVPEWYDYERVEGDETLQSGELTGAREAGLKATAPDAEFTEEDVKSPVTRAEALPKLMDWLRSQPELWNQLVNMKLVPGQAIEIKPPIEVAKPEPAKPTPAPVSAKTPVSRIEQAQAQGRGTLSDAETERLVSENEGLAAVIAEDYFVPGVSPSDRMAYAQAQQDKIDTAKHGLRMAAMTFDPARDGEFKDYARALIRSALSTQYRGKAEAAYGAAVRLGQETVEDETPLTERVPDWNTLSPDQQAQVDEIHDALHEFIRGLDAQDSAILSGIIKDRTQENIAADLGVTAPAVTQRKQDVLARLKDWLAAHGFTGESLSVFSRPHEVGDEIAMSKANMVKGMIVVDESTPLFLPENIARIKEKTEHVVRIYTRDWKNKPETVVVGDQNEAAAMVSPEAALMIKANRPRGFFDIKNNRVVIVADQLSAPDEAIETILHEAIGHYGLRQVLGDKFQEEMLKLYAEIPTEGVREILGKYADELPDKGLADPLRSQRNRAYIAEEYAAQEAQRDPKGPWYAKLLDAIRRALNRILPPEMVSRMFKQGRLNGLIDTARDYVMQGRGQTTRVETRVENAPLMSRAHGDQSSTLGKKILSDEDLFEKSAKHILGSNYSADAPVKVTDTPEVLQKLGAQALPIVITKDTLRKVTALWSDGGGNHGISLDVLKQLPRQLHDPIAIFNSETVKNALVIMTEMLDNDGKTIVVAIHLSKKIGFTKTGQYEINKIASIYGKNSNEWFVEQINKGNLRYLNKTKAAEWNRSRGVQFPKEEAIQRLSKPRLLEKSIGLVVAEDVPATGSSGQRLLTDADIVKPFFQENIRMSLGGQATRTPRANPFETPESREAFYRVEQSYKPDRKSWSMVASEVRPEIEQKGVQNAIYEMAAGKLGTSDKDVVRARLVLNTPEFRKMTIDKSSQQMAIYGITSYVMQGTEQSRAFNFRRDKLETPEQRHNRIAQMLATPAEDVVARWSSMTDEQRKQAVQEHQVKMQKAIDALKRLGIDFANIPPDVLMDNQKMMEIVNTISSELSATGDKLYEYWRNAILSGISTNIVNATSNTAFSAWEVFAQKPAEAFLNMFVKTDAPTLASVKEMWRHVWPNITKANLVWMNAFLYETASTSKIDTKGSVAIPGKLGRIVRVPQRILLATDEWFKTILWDALTAEHATRMADKSKFTGLDRQDFIQACLNDGNCLARELGMEEAKRLLFQSKPGALGSALLSARNKPGAIGLAFKYIFPFVTTPTNLIKLGVQKSPFGALRFAFEGVTKLATGKNAYTEKPELLLRHVAEQMFAWTLTGILYGLTSPQGGDDDNPWPWITGTIAGTPNEQRFKQLNIPPQSIRIGNTWVNYSRFEPFSTALTFMVDGINAFRDMKDGRPLNVNILKAAAQFVQDRTYLQGISDILNAIENPEKAVDMAANQTASWIPNLLRQALRSTDPYVRDYRVRSEGGKWLYESYVERGLQKALPIAAIQPMPRYDHWGRPISKDVFSDGNLLGLSVSDTLWRMLVPARVQDASSTTNLDRMIFNWNRAQSTPDNQWWPGTPRPSITLRGKTFDMTDQQYERYLVTRGQLALNIASRFRWDYNNPNAVEMVRLKKIFDRAGELARRKALSDMVIEARSKKTD